MHGGSVASLCAAGPARESDAHDAASPSSAPAEADATSAFAFADDDADLQAALLASIMDLSEGSPADDADGRARDPALLNPSSPLFAQFERPPLVGSPELLLPRVASQLRTSVDGERALCILGEQGVHLLRIRGDGHCMFRALGAALVLAVRAMAPSQARAVGASLRRLLARREGEDAAMDEAAPGAAEAGATSGLRPAGSAHALAAGAEPAAAAPGAAELSASASELLGGGAEPFLKSGGGGGGAESAEHPAFGSGSLFGCSSITSASGGMAAAAGAARAPASAPEEEAAAAQPLDLLQALYDGSLPSCAPDLIMAALAAQAPSDALVAALRSAACAHMRAHAARFRECEAALGGCFDSYLENMERLCPADGAPRYGGAIELVALAERLGCLIDVYDLEILKPGTAHARAEAMQGSSAASAARDGDGAPRPEATAAMPASAAPAAAALEGRGVSYGTAFAVPPSYQFSYARDGAAEPAAQPPAEPIAEPVAEADAGAGAEPFAMVDSEAGLGKGSDECAWDECAMEEDGAVDDDAPDGAWVVLGARPEQPLLRDVRLILMRTGLHFHMLTPFAVGA